MHSSKTLILVIVLSLASGFNDAPVHGSADSAVGPLALDAMKVSHEDPAKAEQRINRTYTGSKKVGLKAAAFCYIRGHEWKTAKLRLQAILREYPKDAEALNLMAQTLTSLGEYADAETCYEREYKEDPRALSKVLYGKALVCKRRGQPKLALELMSKSLQEVPDAVVFAQRSLLLNELGQTAQSISDIESAIRLDPSELSFYESLWNLCQKAGYEKKAILAMTAMIKAKPCALYYSARAGCYAREGLYVKAIADCDSALALDPNYDDAVGIKCDIYVGIHEIALAAKFLDKYIHAHPTSWHALCIRARLRSGSVPREALRDADQACRIDPKCSEAMLVRSQIKYGLGDLSGAQSDAMTAAKIEPGSSAILSHLANCEYENGDLDAAKRHALAARQHGHASDPHLESLIKTITMEQSQQ